MKKTINRVRQNDKAAAAARQLQNRAGERSHKLSRAQFSLLDEINGEDGAVPLEFVTERLRWLLSETKRFRHAAELLRRQGNAAWERYYAQGGRKMREVTTPMPAAAEGSASNGDTVTLVLEYPSGREFARVDLPADIYARIETCCRQLGITLAEFIVQAVEQKLGCKFPRPVLVECNARSSRLRGVEGKGGAR